jgi:hypothetical protein
MDHQYTSEDLARGLEKNALQSRKKYKSNFIVDLFKRSKKMFELRHLDE